MNKRLMRIVIGFALILFTSTSVVQAAFNKPDISEITTADRTELERQRRIVSNIIDQNFGSITLQGSVSELRYLQKIIDRKLIDRNDSYDLQALGVILGDIMAANLSLRWVVIDDQYGRSRALKHSSGKLFFPVTMISRRVSAGLSVNVESIYNDIKRKVY